MFAADYPFLDVFWTMLVFFFWVIWIWILITVLMDLFGRHDISGWSKALWAAFVIFLPYLGVFIYLITRGQEHGRAPGVADPRCRGGVRRARPRSGRGRRGGGGPADEIAKAKRQLLDSRRDA